MCRLLFLLAALFIVAPAVTFAEEQIVHPTHGTDDPVAPHVEAFLASKCAECHECPNPTAEEPCLAVCPRHGGHFYGQHQADEGPDVVIIDQIANLYKPVVFAHKLHASMANMNGGCTNCHHYSETNGEIPSCRSCHELDRQTADLKMPALKGAYHRQCMNCHRDWSHENACEFCHEEANGDVEDVEHDPTDIVGVPHPMITTPDTYTYDTTYSKGPVVTFHHADHVEVFGQQCVDCHRGDSCARCHDTGARSIEKVDHVTSCFTCHGESDCGFCHDREPMPRFDHKRSTGFDLAPYHSDHACDTCHRSAKDFRHPTGRCADCHIHWEVGSFDHSVTGMVLNEDHSEIDCDGCHLDMDFDAKPSCEDCHDEPMYPEALPGTRR